MHTFEKKTKATQQLTSAKSAIPGRAHLAQSTKADANIQLQRTVGNQAAQMLFKNMLAGEGDSNTAETARFDFSRIQVHSFAPAGIRPNLTLNKPGDIYEQEADRGAEQVMRMQETSVQRQGGAEAEGQGSSRHSATSQPALTPEALPTVHEVLNSLGQSLDAQTRAFFEPRFGHDFSRVRVHADAKAAESARAVAAKAYTLRGHIAFADGRYQPGTQRGRQLIAHELTHVVQQSGMPSASPFRITQPGEMAEREADRVAQGYGTGAVQVSQLPVGTLARVIAGEGPLELFLDSLAFLAQVYLLGRHLSPEERVEAKLVFGDSLNLDDILIAEFSLGALGALARTFRNTIAFAEQSFEMNVLIHELTHCWQYQHDYSVGDLLCGAIEADYDYGGEPQLITDRANQKSFSAYTTEEQAQIVEDYYLKRNDVAHREAFLPYIGCVRLGISNCIPPTLGEEAETQRQETSSSLVPDLATGMVEDVKRLITEYRYQEAIDVILWEVKSTRMPRLDDPRCFHSAKYPFPVMYLENLSKEGDTEWHIESGRAVNITVWIGPSAFRSPSWLYSTLIHEYRHVCDLLDSTEKFVTERAVMEFEAYRTEILQAEGTGVALMEDERWELASRILDIWSDQMTAEQKSKKQVEWMEVLSKIGELLQDFCWYLHPRNFERR
jgi:Domain of unknown function (DUF4157)